MDAHDRWDALDAWEAPDTPNAWEASDAPPDPRLSALKTRSEQKAGRTDGLCHDCRRGEHRFRRGYSCCSYGLYERLLVSAFKERRQPYVGKALGAILYDRLLAEWGIGDGTPSPLRIKGKGLREIQQRTPQQGNQQTPQQARQQTPQQSRQHTPQQARQQTPQQAQQQALRQALGVDLLVPVPASPEKLERRGYGQTEILAEELSRRCGIPWSTFLERQRDTQPMKRLSREERRRNVEGAFRVAPGREGEVAGRRFLLIDDVYTTGATADACADTLLEAGALWVDVLSFAAGGNYLPQDAGWENE